MKKTKTIFLLLVSVVVCHTHAINITGVVKDNAGSGLEGVRVRLGKAAMTATTAPDGSFTLTDGTGAKYQPCYAVRGDDCLFLQEGNRLTFAMTHQKRINIAVYACNGKLLVSHDKVVPEGNHSMTLPHFGSGVHLYRVTVNNEEYTFKHLAGIATYRGQASSWKTTGPAKQAKAIAGMDDALLFIKEGYQLHRIVMKKPDTSGLQITMIPLDTGTITDADGNVYRTVKIGNQEWMAENLRTTKYNNGSGIGSACYFYKNTNDAAEKKKWGALYTDAAANSGRLAPTGWRVPTGADWDTLINYLISHGYNYDGSTKGDYTAKALAAQTDWPESTDSGAIGNDLSLNNASGFSALPAGWKFFEFEKQGTGAYWWIAGNGSANVLDVWWIFRGADRYSTINFGASVRLVRRI